MMISSRTRYALATLRAMAMDQDIGTRKVHEIARQQRIPLRFLEQVLLGLKAGGIMRSRRGKRGGYLLAKPASEITLLEVLRATGDAVLPEEGPSRTAPGRTGEAGAAFEEVWDEVERCIADRLDRTTIQDICRRERELRGKATPEYAI